MLHAWNQQWQLIECIECGGVWIVRNVDFGYCVGDTSGLWRVRCNRIDCIVVERLVQVGKFNDRINVPIVVVFSDGSPLESQVVGWECLDIESGDDLFLISKSSAGNRKVLWLPYSKVTATAFQRAPQVRVNRCVCIDDGSTRQ